MTRRKRETGPNRSPTGIVGCGNVTRNNGRVHVSTMRSNTGIKQTRAFGASVICGGLAAHAAYAHR